MRDAGLDHRIGEPMTASRVEQILPHLMHGGLMADGVAIISSVDPIMGEVDR